MGSVNKVILIGHLGRDAELRFTKSGVPVSSFSMATTETWRDRDGAKKGNTQWHRVVLWGKMAEALQDYLKKGKQIFLEGKLQTRDFEDRKNGGKRYITEVRGGRVVLLGGGDGSGRKRRRSAEEEPYEYDTAEIDPHDAGTAEVDPVADGAGEDDIPF